MASWEGPENGSRGQLLRAGGFLLLSLVLLALPDPAQQQTAALLRATALRPFVWTQEMLVRTRQQAEDNALLRARLDSLVARSAARSGLDEENRRLRGLLSLSSRLSGEWTSASLLRPGTTGSESMFLLNAGEAEGVSVNAPVLTRQGLVGIVREVRQTTSIGMDWTHPDFRASAMDADGVAYGLVEAFRGDFREEDRLRLTGTVFHVDLEPGTAIVTSGLGGVLPRGIPLGRVVEVAQADAGWRKSYWLEPLVDPGSVTHVLVGTDPPISLAPDDPTSGPGPAWPADSILTLRESRSLDSARRDSLSLLRDSLQELKRRLGADGVDSAGEAGPGLSSSSGGGSGEAGG